MKKAPKKLAYQPTVIRILRAAELANVAGAGGSTQWGTTINGCSATYDYTCNCDTSTRALTCLC
jgi:hypothetical protein